MRREPFLLQGPEAQEAFGARLAAACPARALIFLEGELGTGKTTLVRGFLRARGETGPVRSPTYTLIEPYETSHGMLFHLDLYRLADGAELEFLGLRDILDGAAVILIEWPERAGDWLPDPDLRIRIAHQGQARRLTLQAESPLGASILARLGAEVC